MFSKKRFVVCTVVMQTVLFSTVQLRASDAEQHAATIAPFCDNQTILVARLDVSRVDVDAAVELLEQLVPIPDEVKSNIETGKTLAKAWLDGFQKNGGREIFVAISMSDIGNPDAPDMPFFLVVPVADDGNAAAIKTAIPTQDKKNFPLQMVEQPSTDGPLVFGNRVTIDRLKSIAKQSKPADPALSEAFAAVDGAALQIVFIPTADHRRVIREMFPKLPKPLDAVDGPTIADGVVWKAVGIDLPPEFSVRSVVKAKDAAAAERLATAWKQVLAFVAAEPKFVAEVPAIKELVPLLQPSVESDRVVVTMTQESVEPIVKQALLPAVNVARTAAQRSSRMNQFKQLGIAMHNYADVHSRRNADGRPFAVFPPHAIYGEDGQPLLSWRVAILPYLGEQALYDQFHLDEPWDSEHNKTLLEKMPDVYRDNELDSLLNAGKLKPGYTTYVVPVGEGLVFDGKEGTALQDVKDGISLTILVVEVTPDRAVPWTKPSDWNVDKITTNEKTWQVIEGDPLNGVRRSDGRPFAALFGDGHGSTLANDIDPSTFWALLTRAGAEPTLRH